MVQSCLYRVAADLAGVVLTKAETDVNQAVIERILLIISEMTRQRLVRQK